MNMIRKNGGFTLVELIVVIAILAILAGIAVPAYSGYIQSANDAAVETELGAIKTAAMAANATSGEITKIVVADLSNNTHSVTVTTTTPTNIADDFATDFTTFYIGATGTNNTTAGTTITVTIPAISKWESSSYDKVPSGTTAGATWTSEKGWEIGAK